MRVQARCLAVAGLLLLLSSLSTTAHATEMWGRITGLYQFGSINYVRDVWITHDHGVSYHGQAAWDGLRGGLIWKATVPTWANRSYRVTVWSTLGPDILYWNPETRYGSWWWGGGSSQRGPDVQFYLRI